MNDPILGFFGEYRYLSNFWFAPFRVQTRIGNTTGERVFEFNEKWFMVHKTMEPEEKRAIMACTKPGECKALGKTVTLRPDWEDIKNGVMLAGLRLKFGQNPDLADKLRSTGKRYLEETNTWNDRYWGVHDTGRNMLGILLMQVRAELTV